MEKPGGAPAKSEKIGGIWRVSENPGVWTSLDTRPGIPPFSRFRDYIPIVAIVLRVRFSAQNRLASASPSGDFTETARYHIHHI